MNIKALTITALLGAFLAGSNAHAWSNWIHGYNKHHSHHTHKVKKYRKVVKHVYVKPKVYHTHPANGLTNDTYHSHPNGNNHHVHNYGSGGHKHGGHSYAICPYPH